MDPHCEDLQVSTASIVLNSLLLLLIPAASFPQWKSLLRGGPVVKTHPFRPFALEYLLFSCWFAVCLGVAKLREYPLIDCIADHKLRGVQVYGATLGVIQSGILWLCSATTISILFMAKQSRTSTERSPRAERRSQAVKHENPIVNMILTVFGTFLVFRIAWFVTNTRIQWHVFDGNAIYLGILFLGSFNLTLLTIAIKLGWDICSNLKTGESVVRAPRYGRTSRLDEGMTNDNRHKVGAAPVSAFGTPLMTAIWTRILHILILSLVAISWAVLTPLSLYVVAVLLAKMLAEGIALIFDSRQYFKQLGIQTENAEAEGERDVETPLLRG